MPLLPGCGNRSFWAYRGAGRGPLAAFQAILVRHPRRGVARKARCRVGLARFKLGQYQQALQTLGDLTAVVSIMEKHSGQPDSCSGIHRP
jgi:hypothetical protein